jgi:hypothetical protein
MPGDYIGGGTVKDYDNSNSVFSLTSSNSFVNYRVSGKRDDWTALIRAMPGKRIEPGSYNTMTFSDSTHYGFDFFGNGRGCNLSGYLYIYYVGYDIAGNVNGIAAAFIQHCDNQTPAIYGLIRYYQ